MGFVLTQIKMQGGSRQIRLPRELLDKYELQEGDYIKIELNDKGFYCMKVKEIIT